MADLHVTQIGSSESYWRHVLSSCHPLILTQSGGKARSISSHLAGLTTFRPEGWKFRHPVHPEGFRFRALSSIRQLSLHVQVENTWLRSSVPVIR